MNEAIKALLATDLDGTLLNSKSRISKINIEAIHKAKESGIATIPATARSPRSTSELAEIGQLGPIAVCANGAIGWDLENKEEIWHSLIPAGDAVNLVEQIRIMAPEVRFAREFGLSFTPEAGFFPDGSEYLNINETVQILTEKQLELGATKILMRPNGIGQMGLARLIADHSPGRFSITFGSIDWVEVMVHGVTKATGLARAAAWLGVRPSMVTAIGDHLNDIEMLQEAEVGAAVKNAHPDLIAVADVVVPSNDENGVAHFLGRIMRGDFLA